MFVLSFFLIEITSSTFTWSIQFVGSSTKIWLLYLKSASKWKDKELRRLDAFTLFSEESLTKTLVSIFEGSSRDSISAHLPPSRRTFWHFFDIFWCIILLFGFRILDGCPSGAFFFLFALRFTPRLLKMTGMHQCQPLKSR